MAAELIGLRVSVLLNPPHAKRVEGRVADVKNKQLYLEEVRFVDEGSIAQYLVISGEDIADLEVIPSKPPKLYIAPPQPQALPVPARARTPLSARPNGHTAAPAPADKPQTFADPAILSYGKPGLSVAPQELAAPLIRHGGAELVATPTEINPSVSATLSTPFNNLSIADKPAIQSSTLPVADESDNLPQVDNNQDGTIPTASRTRRRRQKKRAAMNASGKDDSSPELTRPTLAGNSTQAPQAGWRQTPILQEIPAKQTTIGATRTTQPAVSKKDKSKRRKPFGARMEDGFGTEEATDIQALEDFDFVGNLDKFDKKAIFAQLRNEDTTADEDLLVSHNRITKPGTFQGTKLHPFENVLQRQRKDSKDPYDSDEDYDTMDALGSRPPYRAASRSSSMRRLPIRSASKMSDSSHQHNDSLRNQGRDSNTNAGGSSPRPQGKAALRYANGHVAPCVWPNDLQEAEELALSDDYGLTDDILAENAGRAIADLALSTISPDGRRYTPGNHNTRPVVVILVGDVRAASRGLAAGRHLQNRGIRVIASAVDEAAINDREEDDPLAMQMYRLKGTPMSWVETSQYLKTLDAPPELIIDCLSGTKDLMSQLLSGAEALRVKETAFQMMAWANKSRASCLAVDCPFGVNPSNGQVQVHEGEPAEIRARVVVCCGAPVTGILGALQIRRNEGAGDDWRIAVCDIGINPALRQVTKDRMAKGNGRAIAFGPDWTVKVKFDPSDA